MTRKTVTSKEAAELLGYARRSLLIKQGKGYKCLPKLTRIQYVRNGKVFFYLDEIEQAMRRAEIAPPPPVKVTRSALPSAVAECLAEWKAGRRDNLQTV